MVQQDILASLDVPVKLDHLDLWEGKASLEALVTLEHLV